MNEKKRKNHVLLGFLTQGAKTMMCLLVLMLSVQAVLAQNFEYGGIAYTLSGGKATATGFGKSAQQPPVLVIPDYAYYKHTPYPVTKIAKAAFSSSKEYRKVVIGDNVTTIEKKPLSTLEKKKK